MFHHGIKGQKWGVRRFQKKDGSLTPAGKKRYDDGGEVSTEKKKSKHRLRLEEKFIAEGHSPEKAAKLASQRIKTEAILGAAATITVGACAAYVGSKVMRERVDRVVKAGSKLQRVELQDTGGAVHDVFYTSKGKHDNERYAGLLGLTRHRQFGQAFLMKLENSDDIRVASNRNAARIFGDLYRRKAEEYVKNHFAGGNILNPNDLSDSNIRRLYDNFNANLIHMRDGGSGIDSKFYSRLKSAGYGAIQDINDQKFSGYRARKPLIVFGNTKNIMVRSVSQITREAAEKGGAREIRRMASERAREEFLKAYGFTSAAILTASTAFTVADDYRKPQTQTKTTRKGE